MTNEDSHLLTIYTEAALESHLVRDLEQLGVPGYTIINSRGKGSRGPRGAAWEANSNIKIEIICCIETVEKLTKFMQKTYFENYAMVMFNHEINVLKLEKYSS